MHGAAELRARRTRIGGAVRQLAARCRSAEEILTVFDDVPSIEVSRAAFANALAVTAVAVAAGLAASKGEAIAADQAGRPLCERSARDRRARPPDARHAIGGKSGRLAEGPARTAARANRRSEGGLWHGRGSAPGAKNSGKFYAQVLTIETSVSYIGETRLTRCLRSRTRAAR